MRELNGSVGTEPIPAAANAQQLLNSLAILACAPLRMIRAGLVHVANGDALHVRLGQKLKHDAEALRADADESYIDFVARRNESRAAEHVTRNDRETRSGGRLLEKLAPRDRGIEV